MAANVKFVAEADVSQVLRADKQVQASQEKTERGYYELADASARASEKTVEAIKREAKAYELAEAAQSRAVRTRSSSSRVNSPGTYGVAPQAALSSRPSGVQAFSGGSAYRVRRSDDESFARFLQAQRVRGDRATARRNSADDVAFADFLDTEHKQRRWRRESAVRVGRENQASSARLRSGLAGGAMSLVGGLGAPLTIAAGAAAGGALVKSLDDRIEEASQVLTTFDAGVQLLAGVGSNMKRRGEIGRALIMDATASNVDVGELGRARFGIQSAFSNMSPATRQALEREVVDLQKLQPSVNLQSAAEAIGKYTMIERDDLRPGTAGVRQASERLAYAADKGKFEIAEMTPYLGDVLNSFQGFYGKGSDASALASLIVGGPTAGRPETAMTALRNMPMVLQEMGKKWGVKSTGNVLGDFRQIAQRESPEILDLVGRDNFAMIKSIVNNVGAFQGHETAIRGITGGEQSTKKKLSDAWADPNYAASQVIKSAEGGAGMAEIMKMSDPAMRRKMMVRKMIDEGASVGADPGQPKWSTDLKAFGSYWVGGEGSVAFKTGLRAQFARAKEAGDANQAEFLASEFGGSLNEGELSLKGMAAPAIEQSPYSASRRAEILARKKEFLADGTLDEKERSQLSYMARRPLGEDEGGAGGGGDGAGTQMEAAKINLEAARMNLEAAKLAAGKKGPNSHNE